MFPRRRHWAPLLAGSLSYLILAPACPVGGQTLGAVETLAEVDAGSGGIEVDARGYVFTADFGAVLGDPNTAGSKVFRISPEGKAELFVDGFDGASGNAIDANGVYYQSNIRGSFVSRVSSEGEITEFVTEGIDAPVGLIFDSEGTLFVANCGSGSIQKVSPDGGSERWVQSSLLACPNGITHDGSGTFYVANFYNGDVIRITAEGEVSKLATLPGGNNGHLVYHEGILLVVARSAHQIFRVGLDGSIELVAGSGDKGGADGPALEASFCYPNDIAVSPDGRWLYLNDVADETSQGYKLGPTRVRRIALAADSRSDRGAR